VRLLINKNKRKDIIEYILLIALFYVTGGAFSYSNYSTQIIIFFVVTLGLIIWYKQIETFLQFKVLMIWLIQALCLILVPFASKGVEGVTSYIAIILQVTIGAFCAILIPWKEFMRKFLNVIVVFATISLFFFLLSFVYPSIALLFPKTQGDASVDYYNAYVYVFMQPKGYTSFRLLTRNTGICWEPGCYQAFLNIGLIFLLEKDDVGRNRIDIFCFTILFFAILTTMSTAGLIILVLTLCVYLKVWTKHFIKLNNFFLIIFFTVIIILILNEISFSKAVLRKITDEFDIEEGSFMERVSLDKIKYIYDEGVFYFFGRSFDQWQDKKITVWNSIVHSFLCLGIPFTILQIAMLWRGAKVIAKKNIWFFTMIMLCCCTESLFWRVFFNVIAYYGVCEKVPRKKWYI